MDELVRHVLEKMHLSVPFERLTEGLDQKYFAEKNF